MLHSTRVGKRLNLGFTFNKMAIGHLFETVRSRIRWLANPRFILLRQRFSSCKVGGTPSLSFMRRKRHAAISATSGHDDCSGQIVGICSIGRNRDFLDFDFREDRFRRRSSAAPVVSR